MAKASRAGVWQSRAAFVSRGVNNALVLTRESLQWGNDVYELVLAPNSQLNQNSAEIETLKEILPIDQADSTATNNLDGTIPGLEAAVTELQNDFNQLLARLRNE